jgi:hypothetical protein
VLFSRVSVDDNDKVLDHFSVPTSAHQGVKARAIIQHEGKGTGEGTWKCPKDPLGTCLHIKLAKDHLQKLLHTDPSAVDAGDPSVSPDAAFCTSHWQSVLILLVLIE